MFNCSGMKWLTTTLLLAAVISISSACGVSTSTSGQAAKPIDSEQVERIAFLNQIADDMYKQTMDGQVIEARNKLMQMSDQIPKIHFEGITSVEGLNALTETITQAKRVYNAAAYSPEEGQIAVAKIRLATDALTHKNQPMWLQYYKLLQNDTNILNEAVKANKQKEAVANFGKLSQHIAIIHPSLLISRDAASVEKLDSLLAFIRTNLNSQPMSVRQLESGLDHLNHVLDDLFMKNKDAIAFVPITDPRQPIIWSLGIGLIIVSVLSFVGWRMYQSGRHIVHVKQTKEGENR
ncbi:sporulation protein YpjB [Paenibacillus alginolyticus]|uniref:Sporulation protein YpjB n=1 Tax=Paenibacillus alginolyticus TaxID=59839 RepID=A0ABT4GCU1_9BACL|nr:sporulation protein YpjB [Paenibacillus alginolyticus]MCY9664680.1 sporulation protein YpjB [Paenibacillus alginolyticus]MCY9693998.1 sporulation protein YpjB [Paenibacillus alginolyticus]MEC0143456.1 sporulation protein YpjB [Paenibacillus alginolyticus]